jgi:probable F420-dependent oxidoreductase
MSSGANQVRLGFGLPVSGGWATPDAMVRFARRAEELGYGSLWTFQRLLHPVDADWGPMYRAVHDPVVTLAYVAAVTERVRLGLAIVNLPYYAPIVLAKQLTTLDAVSGGRLDAGLGLGWAPEEFAAAGVPYQRRGARAEEFIRCLQAIWGPDPVRFDGEFYRVPPAQVDPKPVQRPHPPLLLGGTAPPALRRAGRYADGWISSSRQDLTRIGEAVGEVRTAAQEAGRDPDRIRIIVRGMVRLGEAHPGPDGGRRPLTGTEAEIRGDLATLAGQGVTEVFLDPNFDPRIVSPGTEPAEAERLAARLLETFAGQVSETE